MADEQQVPPLPPTGTIVTDAGLYNAQITNYQNMRAFGGMRDPTSIWQSMMLDDGRAIPYYREIEEKDTDVANVLDTLRDTVLKRDNWVTPADSTPLAQEVSDFVQAQLDGLPDWHATLANLLDAIGYGFSVGELVFDTSEGQASLLDVLDCPQELFLFGNRFQPQIGPLQFLTQPYASAGTPTPDNKFIVCSYRMRSRNRMGRPLLRAVFWESWIKRNIQRLWMRYAEKGPGTAAVKYPDAADAATKQQAAQLAQQLIESTAVAIPQNFEFIEELLKGARPVDPKVFDSLYEVCQLNIVRRGLGETLTSFGAEKGRGSNALGTTHSETLDDKSVQNAKWLAGSVNRQIVRPLVLWNYGPKAPMPTWGFDTDEEKDLTERLAIDRGVQGMGVPMTLSYLQETYGIPAPQRTDVIATPVAGLATAPLPTITPNFAEGWEAGHAVQSEQLRQFDALTRQLQGESLDLLSERVKEVAKALGAGAD